MSHNLVRLSAPKSAPSFSSSPQFQGPRGEIGAVKRDGEGPFRMQLCMHARRSDDLYSNDVKRIRGPRPTSSSLSSSSPVAVAAFWPLGLIHFLATIRRKRPRHDIGEDVRRVGGGLATGYRHHRKARSKCNSRFQKFRVFKLHVENVCHVNMTCAMTLEP